MANPTPVGFDPAGYNSSSATGYTPGQELDVAGKRYRFVRNHGTDGALADGDVCVWTSTDHVVTAVAAASVMGNGPCAGVAVGQISVNNYGFILIKGRHTNVKGVATITAGLLQKASGTLGSGTNILANATDVPFSTFGIAVSTLTGGRYSVEVAI